jgi:hypothetical protein
MMGVRLLAVLMAVAGFSTLSCAREPTDGGIGPERKAALEMCLDGDSDVGKCREAALYAREHGTSRLRLAIYGLLDCVDDVGVDPLMSSPLCTEQQAQVRAAL